MKVDRSLRRITDLLAVWSFTALAITGQLTWATLGIIYGTYAFLFWRRSLLERISVRAWRILNLLLLPVFAICASYDLGGTLVYLAVFLQMQQLIRVKNPRDYSWLFAVSLFQVVLAAAISSELSFLIIMAGFLGLCIVAIVLLTLERGRSEVQKSTRRLTGIGVPLSGLTTPGPPVPPLPAPAGSTDARPRLPMPADSTDWLPGNFLVRLAGACAVVLLVSFFFFMTIPRLAMRKSFMRLRAFDTTALTGFTDQVEMDRLSSIHRDRAMVMCVWLNQNEANPASLPTVLRLRGVALDAMEGNRWFPSYRWGKEGAQLLGAHWSPKQFDVPFAYDPVRSMHVTIVQEMRQTQWLFGPPFIAEMEIEGHVAAHYYPELAAVQADRTGTEQLKYHVCSFLEPSPSYVAARNAQAQKWVAEPDTSNTAPANSWIMPRKARAWYTLVPALPRRKEIKALTDQLTQEARTPYERVARLSRFFHEQFRYSLTVETVPQTHYLSYFLFKQREGHCEMFAAAMAVLCRMAEIPARVVTGFYTTERNQKFFIVRQSHAHTWVEVWLDGFGWLTVDPTPPSALESRTSRFAFLATLYDYWDVWTVLWRRYVLDYSLTDQWTVFARVRGLLAQRGQTLPSPVRLPHWFSLSNWLGERPAAERGNGHVLHKLSLGGLLLLWVVYRRQQKRNGHPTKRPSGNRLCPVTFYADLLALLNREGWGRRPDQTPADFARAVSRARPDLAEFLVLTETYYRIRFAGDLLRPDEEERARALREQLCKTAARGWWTRFVPRTAA